MADRTPALDASESNGSFKALRCNSPVVLESSVHAVLQWLCLFVSLVRRDTCMCVYIATQLGVQCCKERHARCVFPGGRKVTYEIRADACVGLCAAADQAVLQFKWDTFAGKMVCQQHGCSTANVALDSL